MHPERVEEYRSKYKDRAGLYKEGPDQLENIREYNRKLSKRSPGVPRPSIRQQTRSTSLSEKFRLYIYHLETRCDKSGDVQTIAILREDRDALQRRVKELDAELDRLRFLS
jgi:hypothetical protein